jgi:hypothetical protein
MTDNMSESYQWLMVCLNHVNDWWYVWFIPMTDSLSESYRLRQIISDWYHSDILSVIGYDTDILSVIGMIQTYYQSLVWFRHISDWYDSDILSVIGMIRTYHQWLVWFRYIISHWYDADIISVIGMIHLNHTNHW